MRTYPKYLRVLVSMFSFAAMAQATTLAQMNLDQLGAAADAVARVYCAKSAPRWEADGIWTVTTFDVIETMKGVLPTAITVRLPGGRMGHLTATVDGTPKFKPGDEAIVFLERSPGGEMSVTAWVEGTFRIHRDPRTGSETVTQDSSRFAVFDVMTRQFHADGIRQMPFERFREHLRNSISRAQEKSR